MTRLVYFLPAVFLVYVAEANHDFLGKPYELVESCPEYDKLLDAIGSTTLSSPSSKLILIKVFAVKVSVWWPGRA